LLNGATAPLPRLPIRPAGAYEPVRYVRTLDGHMSYVLGLALSPDGKTLASSSEGSVKLWNAATGDVVRTLQGHVGKVGGVVFTNDAKQLVTGDSTTIRLFDVATGAQVRTIEHPHAASVMDLALSLDGKTLFTAGRDGVAKSWDLESGRELHAYAHGAPLYRIGLSPNGVHLVTGAADGTVQVWDARTATRISAWNAHAKKNVNDIAFAPDGTLLATAGDDNVAKVSLFTGRGTLTPRYTIDFTDEAWGVQFSPDGRFLVATSKDQALQVSEALDGTMVARLDAGESTGKVVFSKDSRSMFVTSAAYVQSYRLPYRNSGTTLPVPPESASDQLPKAKNKAHGLYLEAMSLMLRWPATPLDEAKAKLDEAVASDAKSQVAWVGYAQLAVKRGFRDGGGYAKESLDEARKHLEHAASLGPKGAEYWSVTAWVARAANDPAVTRNAVREAYAVVPDEPYAVLADADLANREGRHAAGLELASRVARSTRRVDLQTWAHQFLADSYTGLGDIDAADAAHKKQIELAPQNAWKRANYAYFLLHVAGDPQRAIEEAETGRAMMDHFGAARTLAEAHIEKGHRFLWGAGDAARARAEYDAALAIEKRWPAALYGRAACWRALAISEHDPSLVKRAREDLTAALALSPKFTLARKAMDELDRVTAAAKSK
jgi:tetratricopeptide (TPR) repeat protein